MRSMNSKALRKELALEKVGILFYQVVGKSGQRMLKPLKPDTKISLGLARAILDNTVIPAFYDTLSKNLQERGVPPGTTVQLRAKFSEGHAMLDPALSGTKILCEVRV